MKTNCRYSTKGRERPYVFINNKKEVLDKVKVIGNGAGAGACMLLLNSDLINEMEIIGNISETIELSSDEFFINSYMGNMMFYK